MQKTKGEIRDGLLTTLASKSGINATEEGTIARSFVEAVVDEFYELYSELFEMKQQAYLSTSRGAYTELVAALVDTARINSGETDKDLKTRASNSVYRHAGGNKLAIEEAALSVPGVASIEYERYGLGTGSFVLYVYPETGVNKTRLLANVQSAVAAVVSQGVYFEVRQPAEIPVDISVVLQFDAAITATEKQAVRSLVRTAVQSYVNSLRKNGVLYLNEVVQRVMNCSTHILDMSISDLKLNGTSKYVQNLFPGADECYISGTITVA